MMNWKINLKINRKTLDKSKIISYVYTLIKQKMKQHKEKARELVSKFKRLETSYEDGDTAGMVELGIITAKQCALIAVDEIIKELTIVYDEASFNNCNLWDKRDNWQQVKTAIEKM